MSDLEAVDKAIDDLEEDHREEGEAIYDDLKSGDSASKNDIAEDHREEGESIEDLKEALKQALYENSMLKQDITKVTAERDEAHKIFLSSGKDPNPNKRTYNSIMEDIK